MKPLLTLIVVAVSMLTLSCENQSDNSDTIPSDANDARISSQIDQISDDISMVAEDQMDAQDLEGRNTAEASMLPGCAEISTVVTATTWTRTIDFGDGCEMPNGNILSGIITISGSVDFDQPSMTITYTFTDFHHNNRLVEGGSTLVRTLQSTAQNAALHPVVSIDFDFTVTFPNGNVYTRTGNRVREKIEGYNTPNIWQDNVHLITGSWSTTFPNGSQTATITSPLRREMTCPHIVSGELTVVRNGNTGILNYGSGVCDNLAVLTINGVATTITLGN